MATSAKATDICKSLDVGLYFSLKVTLNLVIVLDLVTDLRNLILCQILDACIGIDACVGNNLVCTCSSDSVNVRKSNLNSLIIRLIYAGYTSHLMYLRIG